MRRASALIAILVFAASAHAAEASDVAFTVVNAKTRPAADAGGTAFPPGPKSGPIRFAWPSEMDQHDLQFDPFVLIAPAVADVLVEPDVRSAFDPVCCRNFGSGR